MSLICWLKRFRRHLAMGVGLNELRLGGMRYLFVVFLAFVSWSLPADEVQLETDSASKNYESELPRIPATEPNDSLSKFEIADGFRIELAASEPLVTDPISMAFDESGRLFVVCMNGYSEDAGDNLGVVRLLEDKDNDGKYETGSDYLTELSWPTAIACYDGGIFLAASPDILYCKDTDGDGVADQKRVVFTGFARNNVQGMLNSFRWGLDNRLYGSSGLNGGRITSLDAPNTVDAVNLRGRDFSIDPSTMTLRPESGGAQHGATFDRWGERFVCSNSDHLQWVEFNDRHLSRNALLRGFRARKSIAIDGSAAEVYRTSAVEPWRLVRTRLRVKGMVGGPVEGGGRAAGYFTSASGLTAYTGDAFPEQYQTDNLFVGDVGSNLVHLKRIATRGLEKTAKRATPPRIEFLTSTDNWFRPVQFANGPDGSLYLIDMYREVIEHPLSLPPMIKEHLDLTSGRDRGRIYRIYPADKERLERTLPGEVSDESLVEMLGHSNGWHRETAARLIVTRCAKSKAEVKKFAPLLQKASGAESPDTRVRAMYGLQSIGMLSEPTLVQRLGDEHPQVRVHALKILESTKHVGEAMISRLENLVRDDDDRIRYQLALTLGSFPVDVRRELLAELASQANNRKMRFAVLSSLGDDRLAMLRSLLSRFDESNVGLLEEVARQIGQGGKAIREALELASAQPEEVRFRLVSRLLDGTGKRGTSLTELLTSQSVSESKRLVDEVLASARRRSIDPSLLVDERLFAIQRLGLAEFTQVTDTMAELLSGTQLPAIQNAAVVELGRFASIEAANQLIEVAAQLNPVGRRKANELLVSRASWARKLLQSVENGDTQPTHIAATYRDKLLRHNDSEIADRAKKLLGTQSDRASVVAKHQALLSRSGDPERGKTLFRKVCSSCHRLDGIGRDVGPDLAPLRTRGAAYLLTNILDPNREVDPRYESYTVITNDGRSISGLLGKDSATSLELTQTDGTVVTISKTDIDQLQATGRSLMPEGLERDLGEQGIADVIAWIVLVEETASKLPPSNEWKFGIARAEITPQTPMLMSGYASRETPATEKLTDLYAKAIVLQDASGERGVLITADVIGIGAKSTARIRNALSDRHGIPAEAVMVCCSHTHTGPALAEMLPPMNLFYVTPEQREEIESYTRSLETTIIEIADEAINNLQLGYLTWGKGAATFATNRRENDERKVPALRVEKQLNGPFDHDVPVLAIHDDEKKLRSVIFGYACHATVLSSFQWSGDYPGFAQAELERLYPDCQAMFWAGCGADQNPLPRRSTELAQHYGRRLAIAVEDILLTHQMKPVDSALLYDSDVLDLAYSTLPTVEDLEIDMQSKDKFIVARASLLKEELEANGELPTAYPYPISRWQLGEIEWLFLGGEVVVDFAIRLKDHDTGTKTWVAAYANDVMAYIPSERVLREGRYEGAESMVYYGLPASWAAGLENQIVESVESLRVVPH